MLFGIDFGTTNSATVEWLNGTPLQHSERAGKPFPSLVAIDRMTGEVVARGLDVREKRSHWQGQCEIITSPKTHLGTDYARKIGNRFWTAKDVAREIFVGLREIVSKRSTLDEAVVAIPVGFSPLKRKELRQAAEEADIKIRSFVSEPTAALFRNLDRISHWQKIVVFDWGGGTLDISLLQLDRGKNITEIAALGLPLGGDDLDSKIAAFVYKEFQAKTDCTVSLHELEAAALDELLVRCETAKCEMANLEEYTIYFPNFSNGTTLDVTLTRSQMQELLEDEFRKALAAMHKVVSVDASLNYKEIGCILMVGGTSKLVGLDQRIQEQVGDCVVIPPASDADWQVAHGAAILSSTPGTYILADYLGIELSDSSVIPIVNSGQPYLRCNGVLNFGIVEDIETARFNFINWSNDSNDPKLARKCKRVGTVLIPCNGFVNETIQLKYQINNNLTMSVVIDSNYHGSIKHNFWEYQNLLFTYSFPAKGSYTNAR